MESASPCEDSYTKSKGQPFKDHNEMHKELDMLQSKIAALENKLKKNTCANFQHRPTANAQELAKPSRTFDVATDFATHEQACTKYAEGLSTDGYNSKRSELSAHKDKLSDLGITFANKGRECAGEGLEKKAGRYEDSFEASEKGAESKGNGRADIYNEILADIYNKRKVNDVEAGAKEENSPASDYSWSSHNSRGYPITAPIRDAKYLNNTENLATAANKPVQESHRNKPLEVVKNKEKTVGNTPKSSKNPTGRILKRDNKENMVRQKSLASVKSSHTVDRRSSCRRQAISYKTAGVKEKLKKPPRRSENTAPAKKQDLWKTKYESLKNKYMKLYAEYNELAENYKLSEQSRKLLQKRVKELEQKPESSEAEAPLIAVNVKKKHSKHK